VPKAAAPEPGEWAVARDSLTGFDLDELNQVVRDHAFITLHEAARRKRWPLVVRAGAKVLFGIGILAIGGPLLSVFAFMGAGSQDYSQSYLIVWACVGSALGCLAVLIFFVPWLMQPHRQWPRTMVAVSVMVAVPTVVLLVLSYTVVPEAHPRWPMVVPVWLCLALSIAAVFGGFRYYSRTKPPAVDLDTLSEEEIEVLRKSRRRALTTLRSRSVVSYQDFREFDEAPL
jgi:hypothetical protein